METYDSYEIFVNRDTPKKYFSEAISDISEQGKSVLVFHGPGGQGKTALRKHLVHTVKPKDKKDKSFKYLKVAVVDLQDKERIDKERLLIWIRNAFSTAGISFPTFDIAFALYWQSARSDEQMPGISNAWLHRVYELLPPGAEGVIDALSPGENLELDALTPGVGVIFGALVNWFVDKTKKAYVWKTRECLKELLRDEEVKGAAEISNLLPKMLAEDLNYHAQNHPDQRFLLLIDTYELLMPLGGADISLRKNPFDDRIREICHRTKAMQTVLFGREPLNWHQKFEYPIPLENNQHSLAGLAAEDASHWLTEAGVTDPAIQKTMLNTATIEDTQSRTGNSITYPLLLQLQLGHWQALKNNGATITPEDFETTATTLQQRSEKIIERVLRDYDPPFRLTLDRLAVADRFDYAACNHIIKEFNTGMPADQFEAIRRLSFVSEDENGFLSLHRATAEAIRSTLSKERYQSSLEALFGHYQARCEVEEGTQTTDQQLLALIEACSLKQRLDLKGMPNWLWDASLAYFDDGKYAALEALWDSTYKRLTNLTDCAEEKVTCLTALTWIHISLGDLKSAHSKLTYTSSLTKNSRHISQKTLARYYQAKSYFFRSQMEFAKAALMGRKAVKLMQTTIGQDKSDLAGALNDLGITLMALDQNKEAEERLRESLALKQQHYGNQHPYLSIALCNLGGVQAQLGKDQAAIKLIKRAISIHRKAKPNDHLTLSSYLFNLAEVYELYGHHKDAIKLGEQALKIKTTALGPAHPSTLLIRNNLANFYSNTDRVEEAISHHREITKYYKALPGHARHFIVAKRNLAGAFGNNGNIKEALGHFEEALAYANKLDAQRYLPLVAETMLMYANFQLANQCNQETALDLLDKGLSMAGDDFSMERATAYGHLGFIHRNDLSLAREYFEKAKQIYQKLTEPFAEYVFILFQQGVVEAEHNHLPEAASAFADALDLANRTNAYAETKALLYRYLGGAQQELDQLAESESTFLQGLEMFPDQRSSEIPESMKEDYVIICAQLAHSQWKLGKLESAIQSETHALQLAEKIWKSDNKNLATIRDSLERLKAEAADLDDQGLTESFNDSSDRSRHD